MVLTAQEKKVVTKFKQKLKGERIKLLKVHGEELYRLEIKYCAGMIELAKLDVEIKDAYLFRR